MRQISLTICDPDGTYLSRMDGFIQRQEHCPFRIRTFTREDMLASVQDQEDILLIREALYAQQYRLSERFAVICLLCEGQPAAAHPEPEKVTDKVFRLFKYQSAAVLYGQLLAICRESLDDFAGQEVRMSEQMTCQITGYYASEDKREARRAARECADRAAQDVPCLYISFEEFPDHKDDTQGLSDLLSLIKAGEGHLEAQMEPCLLKKGNLSLLGAPSCPYDLSEIGDGEWSRWLNRLQDGGRFSQIVIDFANILPAPGMLAVCDRFFLVCRDDNRFRCEQFRKMLIFMGREKLERKISIVRITGNENLS